MTIAQAGPESVQNQDIGPEAEHQAAASGDPAPREPGR